MDNLLRVLLQSIGVSSITKEQSAGTFELKDKVPTSIQVLDLLPLYIPYLPSSLWINNLSQLRYLALYTGAFPGSLSILNSLKNLQTLILQSAKLFEVVELTLPKTPQLRELCILKGSSLFHFKNKEENLKLENLTTVLWLSDLCCNNEALMARIPNVKKLGVRYVKPKRGDNMHPIDLLHTLSHLEQLEDIKFYGYESLKYSGLVYIPKPCDFPPKLKKLKFFKTWMKLGFTMTILGRLPNLEVLQLKRDAFDDSEMEWEQVEEGFPKLKVLVFEDQGRLCRWIDNDFTFPSLECLVLNDSDHLESLPYECLSGCPCLKLIHLKGGCSDGVLESSKKIQNDGDGLLEVREENVRRPSVLGRLPNLEVLHLKLRAFDVSETKWEQVKEGFSKLKVFEEQYFYRWKDRDFTFPSLECLVLKNSSVLESLPYECLSGCPCLKLIHLEGSYSYGVLESAKKIQNDGVGLASSRSVREEF
nr:putative late blight resistance protein homolog R1A-4 [Ipomoea batatas]